MLAFPKIEWYNMNEHKYLPLTYQEGGRKVPDVSKQSRQETGTIEFQTLSPQNSPHDPP